MLNLFQHPATLEIQPDNGIKDAGFRNKFGMTSAVDYYNKCLITITDLINNRKNIPNYIIVTLH